MQDQDKLNQAHAQAQAEAAANAGDKLQDLEPPGKLTRRPVTMGLLRICEAIGLQLDSATPTIADLGVLCFVVAGPVSSKGMWALVRQGPDAFRAAAWEFSDELTVAEMQAIQQEMNASSPPPAGGGDGPTAKS